MEATGRWRVRATSLLGDVDLDVQVEESGRITAVGEGERLDVEGVVMTPEGDGTRVRWTQQLTRPMRVRVTVDALVVGDRLTGTASGGLLLPKARLEGHRVG